ncbi:MAG: ATP-binding protein [Conexivisphaerales archaeon]
MQPEDITRFNPWWTTGKVQRELTPAYKRRVFKMIEGWLKYRQIVLIYGLRRTGKTTLMYQTIEKLLSMQILAKNIMYFSFDEIVFDINEVLETYQKIILNSTFDKVSDRLYIFLDEVQKVDDWANKVKVYYDLYPNIKFFISGSASVLLSRKGKESLAGRIMSIKLDPLEFTEFLELNHINVKNVKENPDLWKRQVLPLFYRYMKYGTFPELATEQDENIAKNYISDTVIDRVIYRDIASDFGIRDIELLKQLIYIIAKRPGQIVNFKEIAKNLGRDERTVANYFELLEYALIIKFIFNYRGSPVASMRKSKKVYLSTPNIAYALHPITSEILPYLLENLVVMSFNPKYFYRNGFEVDMILEDEDSLICFEIKKGKKEERQLRKFQSLQMSKKVKGCIITAEEEGRGSIPVVPAWKLLLDKESYLGSF